MDDKNKYKEALEKLQEALAPKDGCEISGLTRACIEEIFPELKESEDERIREEIIATIHLYYGEPLEDEAKEMISWLEKQGKKTQCKSALEAIKEKPANNANKVEPKFKVKYAGSEYNVLEIKESVGVTFYGIEDEPNHIDYVLPENCEIISGYGVKENGSFYPTKPAVFSEQTSAWSEEDKNFMYDTLSNLTELKDRYGEEYGNVGRCIAWLKSLKQRIGG